MTEEEYYAVVKRLGLKEAQFSETFISINGEPHNVPLASKQTTAQRAETIEKIKQRLGIS